MRTVRIGDRGEWYGSNGEYRSFVYDDMMQCGIDEVRSLLNKTGWQVNFCDFVDYNDIAIRVQTTANDKDFDGKPVKIQSGNFDFVLSKSVSSRVNRELCEKVLQELKNAYSEVFVPVLM